MVAAFRKDASDPLVLLREGKFKKALKILERMEKKNALDFNMRMRLAEAYLGADRSEEAAAVYRAEAESRLAGGDRAVGITLLKKAVKAMPDDEALVKRLKELEGGDNGSAGSASFSFDVGADETGSYDAGELLDNESSEEETEPNAEESVDEPKDPEGEPVEEADLKSDDVSGGEGGEEFIADEGEENDVALKDAEIELEAEDVVYSSDEPDNAEAEPGVEAADVNQAEEGLEVPQPEEPGVAPEGAVIGVEEGVASVPSEGAIATGDELEEDFLSGDVSIDEPETEPQEAGTEGERGDLLENPDVPAEIEMESEETFSAKGDGVDEVGVEPPAGDEGDLEKGATLGGIDSEGLTPLAELFPSLESGDLDFIHEIVERRTLARDEILLREGDEGDSFYIVSKGRFAVYGTFEGSELALAELTPGSVIGEVGFLRSVPRTATVTALEESEVLELSPVKLSRIDRDEHEFKQRLEAILNERIDRTIAMLKEKRGDQHADP